MVPCLLPGGGGENGGDLLDFGVNREEEEEEEEEEEREGGQDKTSRLCSVVALTEACTAARGETADTLITGYGNVCQIKRTVHSKMKSVSSVAQVRLHAAHSSRDTVAPTTHVYGHIAPYFNYAGTVTAAKCQGLSTPAVLEAAHATKGEFIITGLISQSQRSLMTTASPGNLMWMVQSSMM